VPPDQDVETIVFGKTKKEELSISRLIYPAQPDVPISIDQKPDFDIEIP
jgi:hypothetical protein